ncbi:hypothetical protein MXB_81 [Myxobolus squamalis]|nr:hypothetical protein MXB_81 [Myxobolus squamalis]
MQYIEYFLSILNTSFPHTKLHILFTSQTNKCAVLSNIFIFPASILCLKRNVIQMHKNYRLFAAALSDYVFGSLIRPRTIADLWLICGIGRFIYYNFIKHFFGISEYYHVFKKDMKRACSYPNSAANICFYLTPHVFITNVFHELTECLSPAAALKKWCATSHPRLLSYTRVWKCFVARCGLTIKSIEKAVTLNHLIQVSRNWLGICRPLLLTLEYAFNRRRSCMEITIHNDDHELECNIPVNISITVQELDGAFEHSNLISRDAHRSTFEVSTHSGKSRRSNLKRRVTTENGRELDIELIQTSSITTDVMVGADNPALWIRVNLELCTFYGNVRIIQSDSAWYYQSMLESTPLGHLKAVKTIRSFPSGESIVLLGKLIKNNSCWYQIRSEAFKSLVFIYNQFSNDDMIKIDKEHNPIDLYRSIFCLSNYPELPKINDFSEVSLYFFQLTAIKAISGLKMVLLKEVLKPRVFLGYELLRTLYEYNDNASNCYDDCCYRACLLSAIGDSLPQLKNDLLNDASVFVLTESLNSMKIDELCPYFHGCVSFAAISNLLKLQKLKFIEYISTPFRHCCLPGIEERLRLSSVFCLAEYIQSTQSFNDYTFLLDLISIDSSPLFHHNCVKALIKFPPFQSSHPSSLLSKLNTEASHRYLYSVIEHVFAENQSFSLFQQLTVYYEMLYADTSYSQPPQSDILHQSIAVPELKQDGIVKIIIKSASIST